MLAPSDNWGPFAAALSHAERVARLRVLRAFVQAKVIHSEPLQDNLLFAESGEAEDLQNAMLELNRLPALTQRHVLGLYLRHQTYKPKNGRRTPPRHLEGGGR